MDYSQVYFACRVPLAISPSFSFYEEKVGGIGAIGPYEQAMKVGLLGEQRRTWGY